MTSTLEELEVLRTKYQNLQLEWDNQQDHLGRIQGDLFKARTQLKNQSSFCASLGAIMGNLMWRASKLSNVVEVLLSTNRVSEFLCIVSGSLESFVETYRFCFPDVTTNETQFIISLVGIVANMAGTVDGRQFVVTDPNGRELVTQLLTILPSIPEDSGDRFKRVILMCLYNISINQMGLIMLLEGKSLLNELSKNILTESNPELRLLALRLIQSLTLQMPSLQVYENIIKSIPLEVIQKLTNTTDADMRILACSIITNLQTAGDKFGSAIPQENMGWNNKCINLSGESLSSSSVMDPICQNELK